MAFDTQGALDAGYSQAEVNSYLAQHPEANQSSDSQSPAQSQPTQPNPTNPTAAPLVGSVGQIGELTGAPLGFQNAHLSTGLANNSSDLSESTQRLIRAASEQQDPAKRARLLQVAHDNLDVINFLNGQSGKIAAAGQAATPDVNIPGGGTITPDTSMQQALGQGLKTASLGAGSLPAAGALYGAGNTLEENGKNATAGQVTLHAATNALGFYLAGKAGEAVLTKAAQVAGPLLQKIAPETAATLTKLGGGNAGAVDSAGNVIKNTSDYWDAVSNKLVQDAKDLTEANPDAVIGGDSLSTNPDGTKIKVNAKGIATNSPTLRMFSKLGDTGIELPDNNEFTPEDVQRVSSKLNDMAQHSPLHKGEIQALNDSFRAWAQKSFNAVKAGLGDELEGAYANAKNGFEVYNKLDAALQGNLSTRDSAALLNQVKKMSADPNERIILKNAIKDFSTATGTDFSQDVKSMQYKKLPIAKKAWELIKWLGSAGLLGETIRHGF